MKDTIKFYKTYIETLTSNLNSLDLVKIEKIQKIIENKILKKKKIFVCGNGGAASTSNHFLCDFNKGIKVSSKKIFKPKIISLSNSIELITAIGNDIGFNKIFTYQFENYYERGDLLIVFSCSGRSGDIVDVEKFALKNNIEVIKFSGFTKKKIVKKKNFLEFNIGLNNYGICEDIFQSLMHIMSQEIRSRFIKKYDFNKTIL